MVEESNLFVYPVDLHPVHNGAVNYLAASGGQSGEKKTGGN